jgi:transcriptional regulator with XRE-family HTH domain
MKIEWHALTRADLAELAAYIAEDNPEAAWKSPWRRIAKRHPAGGPPGDAVGNAETQRMRRLLAITKSVIRRNMDDGLRPEQLRSARRAAGLTQQFVADRLGVSQAHLALLERGRRPVTAQLGSRIVKLFGLGPTALPLEAGNVDAWDSASLAASVASLGYPGFGQLRGADTKNPALVVLAALAASDVEVRVIEALPWLLMEYSDLDWEWLIRESKLRDAQNRLGFVVTLARQVAEKRGADLAASRLRQIEETLDRSRLVREDTLCQASLSEAERRWLRRTRPIEASHWNLLTDLNAQLLPYAA